ncbi:hypothetical protein [Dethiosulfovibrio salsuginis]|uniref:Uncharacterized protein n=1 Tax=Dethiosulfovibrio salsuginis TaxID=561720 RepID=A0A1X7K2L8_9BACT|nr:hypothetical protein [Dethiosulfovibrio salsuginis]SMG34924.1 hypothetical protein SAMN06275492_12015 [Dethiosulfovibrio salsuginis]
MLARYISAAFLWVRDIPSPTIKKTYLAVCADAPAANIITRTKAAMNLVADLVDLDKFT